MSAARFFAPPPSAGTSTLNNFGTGAKIILKQKSSTNTILDSPISTSSSQSNRSYDNSSQVRSFIFQIMVEQVNASITEDVISLHNEKRLL